MTRVGGSGGRGHAPPRKPERMVTGNGEADIAGKGRERAGIEAGSQNGLL